METTRGRIEAVLPFIGAEGNGSRRHLSGCYLYQASLLAIKMSYRDACDVFNTMNFRKGTADELPVTTFVSDVEYTGRGLINSKKQAAEEALLAWDFDPGTCRYEKDALPEMLQSKPYKHIVIEPARILGYSHDEWALICAMPEEDAQNEAGVGFSKPDLSTCAFKNKRRGSRSVLDENEMEEMCGKYVKSINNESRDTSQWVLHTCKLETNPDEVVYISIDAVLVPEQCDQRVHGGKEEYKEKKTFISHWNIRVESRGSRYSVTSTDREESYKELMAFMLENHLLGHYIVFFTDGEECIFDDIKKYFSDWEYDIYLDWYHLQEKAFNLMTMIIKAERVVDPRGKTEYYKNGPRKGEIKSQEKTSLSRLYARALSLILWHGNANEGIHYLRHIDPSVIKNNDKLNELIGYIEKKKKWITCFALRKRAGLRNSSNGSENQNMVIVSKRQKKKGMSWRTAGSGELAALSALFENQEEKDWFFEGKVSFGEKCRYIQG